MKLALGESCIAMDGLKPTLSLVVTSREVVGVFLKQLWFKFVPVFHGLQGRSALKNRLRELLIIEQYITVHRRIKVFP